MNIWWNYDKNLAAYFSDSRCRMAGDMNARSTTWLLLPDKSNIAILVLLVVCRAVGSLAPVSFACIRGLMLIHIFISPIMVAINILKNHAHRHAHTNTHAIHKELHICQLSTVHVVKQYMIDPLTQTLDIQSWYSTAPFTVLWYSPNNTVWQSQFL